MFGAIEAVMPMSLSLILSVICACLMPAITALDCGTLDCGTLDCGTLDCGTLDCGTLDCGTLDCGPTIYPFGQASNLATQSGLKKP